jgi:hypothetical protein
MGDSGRMDAIFASANWKRKVTESGQFAYTVIAFPLETLNRFRSQHFEIVNYPPTSPSP